MAGLNSVQIGKVGERLFYKLLILGSAGKLEAYMPVADEEHRDFEVHIKGHYRPVLGFQVKCATRLWTGKGKKPSHLCISFEFPKSRMLVDELFWFVFAFLDVTAMGFKDPVFIVPSAVVYKHARALSRTDGKQIPFSFRASMAPGSRDIWSPYRVSSSEVGNRILQILRDSPTGSMKAA